MIVNNLYSLPHFNERPTDSVIDTVVVHSLYCEEEADRFNLQSCVTCLDKNKVSAHFAVTQAGEVFSLVDEGSRAWHAGASKMPFTDDNRENVNDFSIGIELIGDPAQGFTGEQYRALGTLISTLASRHPIKNVVGHDHISPGRKVDPGPHFDWEKLSSLVGGSFRIPTR